MYADRDLKRQEDVKELLQRASNGASSQEPDRKFSARRSSAAVSTRSSASMRRASTGTLHGDMKAQRKMWRRHSVAHIPMPDGNRSQTFDLTDLRPLRQSLRRRSSIVDLAPTPKKIQGMLIRAHTKKSAPTMEGIVEEEAGASYMFSAVTSILLNVLSVVPYVRILAVDPSSPLFIAFVTHIFVVVINLPKVPQLLGSRKLPLHYHAAFVGLAYTFNFLKSDAFSRLPTAVGMVLMNLQMLVGMSIQGLAFKQRFSLPQMSGCAIVTAGVAMAGLAARGSSASSGSSAGAPQGQFLLGVVEILGSLAALVLLSALVKVAFCRYGECVDEQLFMQHLFGIPLFFVGSQWSKIGPKITEWVAKGDTLLVAMLLANLAFTFAGSKARVLFAGRAPNALLVQLVETLTKFISLFVTALVNAPPFPPMAFWGGSGVLILGTLQFLTASDVPDSGQTESGSSSDEESGSGEGEGRGEGKGKER